MNAIASMSTCTLVLAVYGCGVPDPARQAEPAPHVGTAQALSETGCSSAPTELSCSGKDPYAERCDLSSVDTADRIHSPYGEGHLVYSCACKSFWAVVSSFMGPANELRATLTDSKDGLGLSGHIQGASATDAYSVRTHMLYAIPGPFNARFELKIGATTANWTTSTPTAPTWACSHP